MKSNGIKIDKNFHSEKPSQKKGKITQKKKSYSVLKNFFSCWLKKASYPIHFSNQDLVEIGVNIFNRKFNNQKNTSHIPIYDLEDSQIEKLEETIKDRKETISFFTTKNRFVKIVYENGERKKDQKPKPSYKYTNTIKVDFEGKESKYYHENE